MHQMPKTSNQTPSGFVKVVPMRFVMSVKFESGTYNECHCPCVALSPRTADKCISIHTEPRDILLHTPHIHLFCYIYLCLIESD